MIPGSLVSSLLSAVYPGAFATYRMATSRGKVSGGNNTIIGPFTAGMTMSESRLRHYLGHQYNHGDVRPVFTSYSATVSGFAQNANEFNLMAFLEYNGVSYPITFGGATVKRMKPTDVLVIPDAIAGLPATLNASSIVTWRTAVWVDTPGQQWPVGYNKATAAGWNDAIIESTDVTPTRIQGTGDVVTGAGTVVNQGYGPTGVISVPSDASKKQFMIFGNSIETLSGTGASDTYDNFAWAQRTLFKTPIPNNVIPNVRGSRGSQQVQHWLPAVATQNWAWLDYASDVIIGCCTNDIALGGRTAAQIQSDYTTIFSALRARGKRIHVRKTLPRCTGTPTDDTTQTPVAGFELGGYRDQVNAWIDARLADGTINSIVDFNPACQSATDPNKWASTATTDLIHPTFNAPIVTICNTWLTSVLAM